jgi:hypothetical protein
MRTSILAACLVVSLLQAHRLCCIFRLAGLKAGELHGNLTQRQVNNAEHLDANFSLTQHPYLCSDWKHCSVSEMANLTFCLPQI